MGNTKEYCENNKEKIRAYKKKYRENNREKVRACQKAYRENNKDKITTSTRKYYKNNKEKISVRHKAYRDNNPLEFKFKEALNNLKTRCNNANCYNYHRYGGRGITCEWKSIYEFRKDMWESYLLHIEKHGEKDTTIDRIDNSKNYCKENCRWATMKEQNNNRSNNHKITYQGKTQNVSQWSDELGISASLIMYRLRAKWSINKIMERRL